MSSWGSSSLSWLQRGLIAIVKAYRLLLSPWLGAGCRFEPTCSAYAMGAIAAHGAAKGSALAAWRIVRCGPWCAGGHDPVPPTARPASAGANASAAESATQSTESAAQSSPPAAGLFSRLISPSREF